MENQKKDHGYTGVSYIRRAKKYLASVRVDGKRIIAGYFKDPKEAAIARDAAARKAGCTDEKRMNFPKEIEVKGDIHAGSPVNKKQKSDKEKVAEFATTVAEKSAEKIVALVERVPNKEPDIEITDEHRKALCFNCKRPYDDVDIKDGGVRGRCNVCDSFHYIVAPSVIKEAERKNEGESS